MDSYEACNGVYHSTAKNNFINNVDSRQTKNIQDKYIKLLKPFFYVSVVVKVQKFTLLRTLFLGSY